MRRIKQCGLFALSFALLLTAFSTVFSSNAFAASAYDNTIQLTSNLLLSNYTSCGQTPIDITETWESYVQTALQDAIDNRGMNPVFLSSFNDREFIDIQQNPSGSAKTISLAWTIDNSASSHFDNSLGYNALQTDSTLTYHADIYLRGAYFGGCDESAYIGSWSASASGFTVSNDPATFTDQYTFIHSYPVTYPGGYEGVELPSGPGASLYPAFGYTVYENFKINALYLRNISDINQSVSKWNYKVYKADDSWAEDGDYLDSKTLGILDAYEYQLPGGGKYLLKINIQISPPGAPRTDIKEVVFKINADGTLVNGSTTLNDCTDGVCEESSPYEDCSTYGSDLIAGFGCQFRNFGVLFKLTMIFLFVPDADVIKASFLGTFDTIKTALGFLFAPFDFLIQVFGLVAGQAVNPVGHDCSLGTISFMGSSGTLKLCAWRDDFPELWNFMQLILRGGIALGFTVAFWRRFMGIFNYHIEDDEGDSENYDGYEWVDERTGDRGSIRDGSVSKRGASR